MIDACNLALTFLTSILESITVDSPIMFIFGLAIIVALFNIIIEFTKIRR